MTRVHGIEEFVQVVLDARLVFEVCVEEPAMCDVLDERIGCHTQPEENEAYYRMPGPARKDENDICVARVESRSFIEALPRNPSLLSFIKT